jgi:Tfp pilus assembly ATPase PilU
MQTGTARGMTTMEQSLCDLVLRGTITLEVALGSSSVPDQLLGQLERSGYVEPAPPVAASGLRLAES